MYQPKGKLSACVQAVWSASVNQDSSSSIKRWLQGDACSGIMFNLGGPVYLDKTPYSGCAVLLPVSKQAQSITLPPGAQVTGIRLHPGITSSVFGTCYDRPVAVKDDMQLSEVQAMTQHLIHTPGHYARMTALYKWLNRVIDFPDNIPTTFMQMLNTMPKARLRDLFSADTPLSQRQLERKFQDRMGMTIKQVQRILRVQKSIHTLKNNPDSNLVELALDQGFSDQSHMTREFKQIAKITPRKYSQVISSRQA